jgi:hypothetical protein
VAIYDPNGVPQLDLSEDSRAYVDEEHSKAVAEWEKASGDKLKKLRLGEQVFIHNKAPINTLEGVTDVTVVNIGAATLDEALKDCVGAFDQGHVKVGDHVNPPEWVASTDGRLAELLAEHYTRSTRDHTCRARDVSEVALPGVPPLQNTRVAVGRDIESAGCFQFASFFTGTSTAVTATSLTTASTLVLNAYAGQYVVTGNRFGIIQSNTAGANGVLTIDRWYDASSLPANVAVAAASNPATGVYMILPGQVPCAYMGITATATTAVDGDTVLTGEITTAGGGLTRQLATYAHTAAGTTTTLTLTYTANGSDSLGSPVTIAQIAIFQGVVVAASRMFFRTLLNATATITISGDQLQVTETVTL